MRKFILILILILGIGLTAQGQFNAFFGSHNSIACRPTGLTQLTWSEYVDDFHFIGTWDSMWGGYLGWRDAAGPFGGFTEIINSVGVELSSLTVGQKVYSGFGSTHCDSIPNGYYLYLVDAYDPYNPLWFEHYQPIHVVDGYINEIYYPFGKPSWGYLYNWYAILGDSDGDGNFDSQICPSGWHVPSNTEWQTLINYLIANGYGYGGSGDDIAKSMAWTSEINYDGTVGTPGNNPSTNNSSGLGLFPAGYRINIYEGKGTFFYYWTSTIYSAANSYSFSMFNNSFTPFITAWDKHYGIPIRLIKDNSTEPTGNVMKDYDGNKYPTIKIGNQVWMASNLKVQHYTNGLSIPEVQNQTTWDGLTTGARCVYNNQESLK